MAQYAVQKHFRKYLIFLEPRTKAIEYPVESIMKTA
jgi:hypothetical protein